MNFVQNFPFFCIVLSMFGAIITSVLNAKIARILSLSVLFLVGLMSFVLLAFCVTGGERFVYMMGHFEAPWGNVIRAGILEAGMALFFSVIMFCCVFAGKENTEKNVEPQKVNLFYLLINVLLGSMLALIYTNDMFTAYVFVEMNTLAACGLIIIRQKGHAIVAGMRYMVMSLLGSGLFLIGICFLYDITGHLVMSEMKSSIIGIIQEGTYALPLQITIGLTCAGLAIKSALFPFHSWVPDTYGYAGATSASLLSSLVSKAYVFLLIKVMYRVIGLPTIRNSSILDILYFLGVAGMIVGSIGAIRELDLRRMIAYSSVAQIGYIYMGIGLGSSAGMVAAVFHILVHASAKSLLFMAGAGLTEASGDSKKFVDLTGSGFRNPIAGIAFAVGCLSMVGIPIFAGFMSKVMFATAAVGSGSRVWITLLALVVSTILNAMYFLRTLMRVFTKTGADEKYQKKTKKSLRYVVGVLALCAVNIVIGISAQPMITFITEGLSMF